ncbi:MAG: hypothetical protein ACKOXB_09790 [Flavobacteriales bacterium]
MKFLTAIFIVFLCDSLGAQDTATVTIPIKQGFKQWTKPEMAGRFGIGIQKAFYTEFGVSGYSFYYNDRIYSSATYYGAFEWSQPKDVYGFKVGYEANASLLALGFESKYQFNRENHDLVLTPKVGIGVLGIFNIFYGYNISLNNRPFDSIGPHQVSMIFNFNKKMFNRYQPKNQSSPPLPGP